jgi:thioredoxin reductase (NADPH)
MAKPVMMAVDDDPEVLRAVERDLRTRYAENYRIVRASSGGTALQALQSLRKRNEAVGLFLVDQRMPEMSGVEFIAKAIDVFPEARRVLLTTETVGSARAELLSSAR